MKQDNEKNKQSLRIEVLNNFSRLITTGLGLVAALAWNDAIKQLFNRLFEKPENSLLAMFGYAVFITILVVILTIQIGRLIDTSKKSLDREKNG